MALIKCPECGKEISDTANVCIHCGYKKGAGKRSLNWIKRYPNTFGAIIVVILFFILYVLSNKGVFANPKQREAIENWQKVHEENQKTMDEVDEFLEKYDFDD